MNKVIIQPPESETADYLTGLNPEQKEAVKTTEGPLLVLAGAGTGKTRVLTTRIAHILGTHRAMPGQIFAVTFTNKAAQEMKERVSGLLTQAARSPGPAGGVEGWWIGTFHALAARMLRRHADLVGLTSAFTIIDTDDTQRLLKKIMEELGIDTKKSPPKAAAHLIGRYKDRALLPVQAAQEESPAAGPRYTRGGSGGFADGRIGTIYRLYQERLKAMNACDFGDLLMHVIHILKQPENGEILMQYHRRFRYLLVDEYQDTNTAQYLWLRLLAQGSGNICCVGDDDQSIYGWRGAELGNILKFESDFPDARVIRLEQNYRSTNRILKAAAGLITANSSRLGKELWSEAGEGEKVTVKGLWDGAAEARWVAEQIEELSRQGSAPDEIAILVRAGFQMREFEERFIQLGIPYRVYGGLRFYERSEVRDALAYFRVVVQTRDDLAFERIINVPKRGIGNTTLNLLNSHARMRGLPLYQAVKDLLDTDELKPKVRSVLAELIARFEKWRSDLQTLDHGDLAGLILKESGYMEMWNRAKTADAPGRVENLNELVAAVREFESLPDFLEHVSLVLENQSDPTRRYVTMMTLHAAKGLEFENVFLTGWEEGLFPSQRTIDETGLKGLEEERRLAYVGLTRARRRAFVSYAGNRRMYGGWVDSLPSRFVDELPAAHIDFSSDIHSYGAYDYPLAGKDRLQGKGRSVHWDSSGMKPRAAGPGRTGPWSQGTAGALPMAGGKDGRMQPGVRVRHEKFGAGTVVHVDGHKLDIRFDETGNKRVLESFLKPED